MATERELWKNLTSKAQWIIYHDIETDRLVEQKVASGAEFRIAPANRAALQASTQEGKDRFSNGDYGPVKLVEATADFADELEDTDYMSDEELSDLLKGRADALANRVAEIENRTTLERLIAIASEKDMAASKMDVLRERLDEITRYTPRGLPDGTQEETVS